MRRRDILPWLVLGVGLPGMAYSMWRQFVRPVVSSPLRPRWRKRRRRTAIGRAALPAGLYVNTRSHIVHMVEGDGIVRGVDKISLEKLVATAPPHVADASSRPRVRLSNASRWFEEVALSRLKLGQIDGACAALLDSVHHDLIRIQRGRDPVRPSFRLYDLLTAVAVRFDRRNYITDVVSLIRSQPPAVAAQFERRLLKWGDPASRWSRAWQDRTPRRQWAGLPK